MIEFVRNHWDKLLGIVASIAGAVFLFYRRVIRNEDKLAQHLIDDRELRARLDGGLQDIGEMKLTLTRHEVIISETRDDVSELKQDVKALLARRE